MTLAVNQIRNSLTKRKSRVTVLTRKIVKINHELFAVVVHIKFYDKLKLPFSHGFPFNISWSVDDMEIDCSYGRHSISQLNEYGTNMMINLNI
jgi:hypothetical protein